MSRRPSTYRQFKAYYDQYFKKVYAYLFFRSGRDRDLAEDLTSEVFLKALERFHTFDPERSPFGAWVYAIAHNHLIDHYRQKKVNVSLDDIGELEIADTPNAGELLDTKRDMGQITAAIDKLPLRYAEVLRLKFLRGLDNHEIGTLLGKSQTNVRVLIHRSLSTLKKKIHPSSP